MYDSLIRNGDIIRIPIHKDNNNMVGTKGFKVYKYKFEDYHYKGISILQEYFGKKISSSNGHRAGMKLSFLKEMKAKQFYTTQEKIKLNDIRMEYLLSKKPPKNDT